MHIRLFFFYFGIKYTLRQTRKLYNPHYVTVDSQFKWLQLLCPASQVRSSTNIFFLNNLFLSSHISSLRNISCFILKVLPSLREKHDEFMLRELVKRWTNHKIMVRWLSRFFHYLDRYFIARRSLPALNEVGLTCFRDLVRIFPCYFTFYKFTI